VRRVVVGHERTVLERGAGHLGPVRFLQFHIYNEARHAVRQPRVQGHGANRRVCVRDCVSEEEDFSYSTDTNTRGKDNPTPKCGMPWTKGGSH
jgi:hypothetical protein